MKGEITPSEKESESSKIKKLRVFGELILAVGKDKLIFKKSGDAEHLTLKFFEEGILDVHRTTEGKKKRYTKLEKIDLAKLLESVIKEIPNILEEIDINSLEYANTTVVALSMTDVFKKIAKVNGKEAIIKKDRLKDIGEEIIVLPMKRLQEFDFKIGWLLKEGNEFFVRFNERYFIFRWNDVDLMMKKALEEARFPQEKSFETS